MTDQMTLRNSFAGIRAGAADIEKDEPVKALDYLQSIYRDPLQPASVRMRAASIAVQYETPKLAVTGYIKDQSSFAEALERAVLRSTAAMRVIEHDAEE
jgi:hypothetical protein